MKKLRIPHQNQLTARPPYGLCADIGWACSSAGEHYVDIVGVTGSIPVTPTIQITDIEGLSTIRGALFSFVPRHLPPAKSPDSGVGKHLRQACREHASYPNIGTIRGTSSASAALFSPQKRG